MNCMVHSILTKLQERSKHNKLGLNYFNFPQKRHFPPFIISTELIAFQQNLGISLEKDL